jgi:flagellar motor switch protein FliN
LLDTEALPVADESGQGAPETFQAAPDVDLDSVDLSLDQAASEFKAVPDVDLDAVDLNLEMPFAETRGDEGAAVAPPRAVAPAPPVGGRTFAGLGTGGSAVAPKDELLELNLSDLESGTGAPAGGRTPAPDFRRSPGMAVAGVSAGIPAAGPTVGSVLLSIPHQVQVRMGSVSLLGEEILNLSHGSVVPLNRAAGEPVDLTLDGKTIAQGEIVVINGRNLGVRIVSVSK